MDRVRYPIVELRQYTLRPGQREVLIGLFDRELVESQEAEGMAVVGQFRDTGRPDRPGEHVFVWLARFNSPADLDSHLDRLDRSTDWRDRVSPALSAMLTCAPQRLRLAPTARSLLR